jgi:hypothetical protein
VLIFPSILLAACYNATYLAARRGPAAPSRNTTVAKPHNHRVIS